MKKIFISVRKWETRIAITQNDLLQSIYLDSHTSSFLERSFFKGKVAKVLPGVQTAFVDIGQERAGFLHISEIDRDLAFKRIQGVDEDIESGDREHFSQQRQQLDISKVLKKNDDILVQVSKEPINEKGAKLTTCFTLPGRFVVLMPNINKVGISKKITDVDERTRLRKIVLKGLPEEHGCIIRTTCINRDEGEIIQDLQYLLDIWNDIQKSYKTAPSQAMLYSDIDLYLQVVRDHLDKEVEQILCDDKKTYEKIYNFVKQVAPEFTSRIFFYDSKQNMFDEYNIETQIHKALHAKVDLPSGGSIVIDRTEAMTVIDVNTGRYVGVTKLEDTLLNTNLEAAEAIVRQLKLRNIGGLIVIDFIDMSLAAYKNKLFTTFEQMLKERDRSQAVVLKISEFGLVQMTRKRTGKSLRQQLTKTCHCCNGTGVLKALHAQAYEAFRDLEAYLLRNPKENIRACLMTTSPELCEYILEYEPDSLLAIGTKFNIKVTIRSDNSLDRFYRFEYIL